MLNSTVNSLKVDPKSNNVYGTVDQDYDDDVVYDHVIMTADVGAVQEILNNTYANYKQFDSVLQALVQCNNNSIGQMKIAPDYRVRIGIPALILDKNKFLRVSALQIDIFGKSSEF